MIAALNRGLDDLVRPEVPMLGRLRPAFQVCGLLGLVTTATLVGWLTCSTCCSIPDGDVVRTRSPEAPVTEPIDPAVPAVPAVPAAPAAVAVPTARPGIRDDLDDGLRFVHLMAMQSKRDIGELATRLFALLDELARNGRLDLATFDRRRASLQVAEDERTLARPHVAVADPVDKYQLTALPEIDWATRMPLCQARCCTLPFALSFQDLDERVVAWDYRRPYQIRQRADCYCTHCDGATRKCGVYAQRPATGRSSDCRQDSRIWLDFERRIPAPAP